MHICPCSRALEICKNIGIRTYFGSVTAEIMGGFCHFANCSLGNRLASFFIVPENCIFWGASFELIKPLATLLPKRLQGFHGTLVYHCFVYLAVCWYKPRKSLLRLPPWALSKTLWVYPLGTRSSSCGPTKGTPPPRTTLRTIWG